MDPRIGSIRRSILVCPRGHASVTNNKFHQKKAEFSRSRVLPSRSHQTAQNHNRKSNETTNNEPTQASRTPNLDDRILFFFFLFSLSVSDGYTEFTRVHGIHTGHRTE